MASILILYSTTDGHTRAISQRIRDVLESHGHAVRVVDVNDAGTLRLDDFDKVLIGASIRYGKHSKAIVAYINAHAGALAARPNAFFSVNAVARKPEKRTPETNPYLNKLLPQLAWKPNLLAVFAGKIDYPRYGFIDKQMIRFIMWMTKGPTDPRSVTDFTDWQAVEAFARRFDAL